MSRKLITTAGRKQVVGRPMLYKTTREFLLRFGLKDISELPSMEEFEKMAAVELSETDDYETADEAMSEPVEQSGELFTDEESAQPGLNSEPERAPQTSETKVEVPQVTPAAEPSKEAAEAQAPVERQDAVEIEAEV
jgi:segregation and condensation protein B